MERAWLQYWQPLQLLGGGTALGNNGSSLGAAASGAAVVPDRRTSTGVRTENLRQNVGPPNDRPCARATAVELQFLFSRGNPERPFNRRASSPATNASRTGC